MSEKPKEEEQLTRSERINIRISVTQTILALAGIFIGSVALYAALSESEAVRKQTQASVWPRLDIVRIYYGFEGEERIDIVARNRGIGPADVKSVHVAVDGQPMQRWGDVIRTVAGPKDFGTSDRAIDNTVISPQEDVVMLSLEEKYSSRQHTRALRDAFSAERVVIEVCYCSVFGSCWQTRSNNSTPEEVKACKSGEPSEF